LAKCEELQHLAAQPAVAPDRAIARANRRLHALVAGVVAEALSRTRAAGEPRAVGAASAWQLSWVVVVLLVLVAW